MERTSAQKMKWWIAISAAVGGTVLVAVWIWVLNSEPYAAASNYTKTSPEVTKQFGIVRDISLRAFDVTWDDAQFRMAVVGTTDKGMVTVSLKKDPNWRVDRINVRQ